MAGSSRKRSRVIEGETSVGSLHPVATRILQFEDHPIRATVAAEETLFVLGDIQGFVGRNAAPGGGGLGRRREGYNDI